MKLDTLLVRNTPEMYECSSYGIYEVEAAQLDTDTNQEPRRTLEGTLKDNDPGGAWRTLYNNPGSLQITVEHTGAL